VSRATASLARGARQHDLVQRSIDIETYDRHTERLREELTRARIAKHATELDELDVEGLLGFAGRVLPRAADLWVQAPLEQRQRFQQSFFPEGRKFDGQRFVRTAATAPAFSDLRDSPRRGWGGGSDPRELESNDHVAADHRPAAGCGVSWVDDLTTAPRSVGGTVTQPTCSTYNTCTRS